MSQDVPERPVDARASETLSDPLRVPLAEEFLTAKVEEREQGLVRIHKHVETVPMKADIDLLRETAHVDRRPCDEVVDATRDPWYEGDTLVIPRYEERLVTEKRLVLVEEIRVEIRPDTEQVHLRDTVRREVVDIDEVRPEPES